MTTPDVKIPDSKEFSGLDNGSQTPEHFTAPEEVNAGYELAVAKQELKDMAELPKDFTNAHADKNSDTTSEVRPGATTLPQSMQAEAMAALLNGGEIDPSSGDDAYELVNRLNGNDTSQKS